MRALRAVAPGERAAVDRFGEFWDAFPRKRAKKDAREAWARLNPSDELVETILDAIDVQRKCRQWRDGYIPYPATWLRGELWEDELGPDDFYKARL